MSKLPLGILLATLPLPAHVAQGQDDDLVYMGRAFLFEADLEQGRAAGWAGPDETDDEILDAIAETLQARVRSTGRFVEARVEREKGAQLSVTFVGPQAPTIEEFLIAGLSSPGRLAYRPAARAEDLAAMGTTLEAERERVRAWTADHPESALSHFQFVPREDGGPAPDLLWLPGPGEGAEPILLLRGPEHVLAWPGPGALAVTASRVEGRYGLSITLGDEVRASLQTFFDTHAGRPIAVVLNDEVVELEGSLPAQDGSLGIDLEFGSEEIRPLLLSAAGEPLRAPLRFVGFGKRELRGVKRRLPGEDG